MEKIIYAAESKGLKAYGVKIPIELFEKITMPVIALTHNPDHYLILTKISEEGVHITDPGKR